jgi:iron complex transport system substrate-binding protein
VRDGNLGTFDGTCQMPARIASLLPAATETLCALGRAELIVGVSHECTFPPEIAGRPVLTEPRGNTESLDDGADDVTENPIQAALSVHAIKEDALRAARPDFLVTADRSEACGVSSTEVERAVGDWLGYPISILYLKPRRLDDLLADVGRVAGAVRCDLQGRVLLEDVQAKLEAIREQATRVRSHPRVACIQCMEPLTLAGNWIPELVELCGGAYGLLQPGEPPMRIKWHELLAYEPEVVILMPDGLTLAQTRRARSCLTNQPEWAELPAVCKKRVYSADGTAYLYRAGPRIGDGAALLAGLIQPSFFASRIPVGSYELVR